ncbi:MAG: hypothetical protein RBQ87_01280 [Candidatus Cloacimonadaceae bacterium]|jgi:hypothetical protein|nr:hypothetical protein [Candidatus Cloacimonadaceae bacterium]
MDQTASEKNIRYSLRRFLTDEIETANGKSISFDTALVDPALHEKTVAEWIVVKLGPLARGGMSEVSVELVCATRGDHEGIKLSELSDIVFATMTDDTKEDGKRRIPFYNSSLQIIGALLVQDVKDGGDMSAPDRTKFKIINCRIRWVAKA